MQVCEIWQLGKSRGSAESPRAVSRAKGRARGWAALARGGCEEWRGGERRQRGGEEDKPARRFSWLRDSDMLKEGRREGKVGERGGDGGWRKKETSRARPTASLIHRCSSCLDGGR